MIRAGVICLIVELSVAPDAVGQLAEDADKVYAEILKSVPGYLFGTLGVERESRRALGVVYFESEETLDAAGPVIDGIREAVAISPGVTFTLTPYEVLVSRAGLEASRLFAPIGGTATPGAAG
jgi:hypothetical protein